MLALANLIQTIGKHIIPSFILAVIIVTIAGGLFIHLNIQHLVTRFPTVEEEQRTFDRTVVINDLIITEIQDVVKTSGADRANINQFRNGQFDLTGVPFNYAVIAYSASSPGVTMDDRLDSSVSLSIFNDFLPVMWSDPRNPICVIRDTTRLANPMLRFRLEQRGTQVLAACPVVTPTGAAVGFITVEYLRSDAGRPSDEEVFTRMKTAAARTSTYLLRISAPHR